MAGKKGMKHFGEAIILDVLEMKKQGKTHHEIAKYYGLDNKMVIKSLVCRHNHRQKQIKQGVSINPKGRPRKQPVTMNEKLRLENNRLKMENELLRNFLYEIERGCDHQSNTE